MLDIIFFDLMARSECFLFHCATTPHNARKAAACRTAQSALDGLLSRQSRKFRRSLSRRHCRLKHTNKPFPKANKKPSEANLLTD